MTRVKISWATARLPSLCIRTFMYGYGYECAFKTNWPVLQQLIVFIGDIRQGRFSCTFSINMNETSENCVDIKSRHVFCIRKVTIFHVRYVRARRRQYVSMQGAQSGDVTREQHNILTFPFTYLLAKRATKPRYNQQSVNSRTEHKQNKGNISLLTLKSFTLCVLAFFSCT